MGWIVVLGFVTVVVALAALGGLKPSGTRPVARTKLMVAARAVLVLVIIAAGALAWLTLAGS